MSQYGFNSCGLRRCTGEIGVRYLGQSDSIVILNGQHKSLFVPLFDSCEEWQSESKSQGDSIENAHVALGKRTDDS